MKKSLIVLALLASFGVHAQTSTAQSQAASGSTAGANSGSTAVIYLDQSAPSVQTINQNVKNTGTLTTHENVNYSGKIENVNSGTTTQNIHQSGTTAQILHTSGGTTDKVYQYSESLATIKNVPGIAMSGPASGPCTGASGGLGLAGPGFGIGLNGAKVEPSCVLRENIRVTGMAMQSLDGAAHPQQKGELLVMMMDQMRGLAAMSAQIIEENVKSKAK